MTDQKIISKDSRRLIRPAIKFVLVILSFFLIQPFINHALTSAQQAPEAGISELQNQTLVRIPAPNLSMEQNQMPERGISIVSIQNQTLAPELQNQTLAPELQNQTLAPELQNQTQSRDPLAQLPGQPLERGLSELQNIT